MRLIAIRGLPNTGKSSAARALYPAHLTVEGDMFFYSNGRYVFDKDRLSDAHTMAQTFVRLALSMRADVVVTGTMTRRWEVNQYKTIADDFGAAFTVLRTTDEVKGDNGHCVPTEILQMMKERWEDWNGEKLLEDKSNG